jgi:hypothetical protein
MILSWVWLTVVLLKRSEEVRVINQVPHHKDVLKVEMKLHASSVSKLEENEVSFTPLQLDIQCMGGPQGLQAVELLPLLRIEP